MRAIAVRRVARLLAHTQESLLILFGFKDLRLKSGRLVGAIAKGLPGGMAAGAPSVGFAGLEVGAYRGFVGYFGLFHDGVGLTLFFISVNIEGRDFVLGWGQNFRSPNAARRLCLCTSNQFIKIQ